MLSCGTCRFTSKDGSYLGQWLQPGSPCPWCGSSLPRDPSVWNFHVRRSGCTPRPATVLVRNDAGWITSVAGLQRRGHEVVVLGSKDEAEAMGCATADSDLSPDSLRTADFLVSSRSQDKLPAAMTGCLLIAPGEYDLLGKAPCEWNRERRIRWLATLEASR